MADDLVLIVQSGDNIQILGCPDIPIGEQGKGSDNGIVEVLPIEEIRQQFKLILKGHPF